MSSVQFPAEEALQRRGYLVHQRATTLLTERFRLGKVHRLVVVENVAIAIVRRSAAQGLVTE